MTNARAFIQAFAPFDIEPRGEWMAIVDVGGDRRCVTTHYCAHCRDDGTDGEAWCVHKEAAFGDSDDAQDQYETYRDALDAGVQ